VTKMYIGGKEERRLFICLFNGCIVRWTICF